jgi:uncharacterized membrane protein YfcA
LLQEIVVLVGLVLSLAIGLSLGLLGGGGSTLTVPVLHYVFGLDAHDAISASLVIVGITSTIALVPHARRGLVSWRVGAVFGAASMVAAFAGGSINAALPGPVLMIAFAFVMLASGGAMLVRDRRPVGRASGEPRLSRLIPLGLGVGLLTGILGAGGGFLIVPALVLLGGLPIRTAIATSLLVIAMNALAAFAGTASHVTLDIGLVSAVLGMAVAGCLIGARLGHRLSTAHLQRAFAVFVITIGLAIAIGELS